MSGVDLLGYRSELKEELNNILAWWTNFAVDPKGGFWGKIDHDLTVYPTSPKGAVLNARILWSFSAGYSSLGNDKYLEYARRAFDYICTYFIDRKYGGVYWTVDADGQALDTKKQVYAISFVIYALAEYSRASGDLSAQDLAIRLYHDLEENSFDSIGKGYFEAFNCDWSEMKDLRLSEKDANERKTMNTHLHVLEAYTNLYRNWKDEGLKRQISNLIDNFRQHIIRKDNHHLNLFMDDHWYVKSSSISFGHDIEAAWLLLEAAEVIGDPQVIQSVKALSVEMAHAALSGMDKDGGMFYEFDPLDGHMVKEKHWWVQAESMVGFFNAWQLSNDDRYLSESLGVWKYVKSHILDPLHGEWIWGRDENNQIMKTEDKAGMWKCPYHNSRACLELIRRINDLQ